MANIRFNQGGKVERSELGFCLIWLDLVCMPLACHGSLRVVSFMQGWTSEFMPELLNSERAF